LGPNQLVHGLVNEQPFIAVTPETTLSQAVPLGLSIDKSNLHIFDNLGKRIHPNNFTSQESYEDATSLTTALA
ncbi:sn-glycerol-3-phosphate ABC transporter ATP-binding protein UgpC, partial [Vibrio breoganii]